MQPEPYPLENVYRLIEPGPVVLLTTADDGQNNVMTMSWHMMVEFTPPMIACVVSAGDHSYEALHKTGECVIAIPSVEMAEAVVGIGNCSGRETDKFATFNLTPAPARDVSAPLITQCFANLECQVRDTRMVKDYNIFVLEVVHAWRDPMQKTPRTIHHCGYGNFTVDGEVITLKSDMP